MKRLGIIALWVAVIASVGLFAAYVARADGAHDHPALEQRIEAIEARPGDDADAIARDAARRVIYWLQRQRPPAPGELPPGPPEPEPEPAPGEDPGPPPPTEPPPPQQGATLADCIARLDANGDAGGWCALGAPMATVRPTHAERPDVQCNGADNMLLVWTGAAWDGAERRMYFPAAGGHVGYCGNEVYALDVASGKWSRLTEPARRTLRIIPGAEPYGRAGEYNNNPIMAPPVAEGPSAGHTYDGVQFSRRTGTIFWVAGVYANETGNFDSLGELWEFNPSRTETRNGIAPLKWKLWRKADGTPFTLPLRHFLASLELPGPAPAEAGGDLVYAGFGLMHAVRFDPRDPPGTVREVAAPEADRGNGNMVWDAARGVAWARVRGWLARYALDGSPPVIVGEAGAGAGNGLAIRNGKLITWNGLALIHEYDPDADRWLMWDWGAARPGEGDTAVYSRWVYLPEHDLFLGVSGRPGQPVVYRHPTTGGVPVSTAPAQGYIDAAAPGAIVTIPPGVYPDCLTIDKPIAVRLKDVRLMAVCGSKARIVVSTPGPVLLEDFATEDPPRCGSNCAGVRIEGPDTEVTLKRARILNHEMGVLSGNAGGGRLFIEDSEIGATGGGGDLSHVVYAGWSDRLEIRNSTIRDSMRLGHLVKSRAAVTVIEDSRILGGDSRHSRLIEAPCGGTVTIADTEIRQSARTDNAELMMVGGGNLDNCVGNPNRPGRLSITGGSVASDRRKVQTEPAWQAGPTALVKWLAPNSLDVTLDGVALSGLDILAFDGPAQTRVPLP